ncbi:MAG: metallophosphoesterase family protein [Verrucomicrobia bacterium]|nr:metallophosphoesterase family protein [Verrucomicrobiota bacterium]MCH8514648.1 metallophosphoesterase family protein [Kiritimatiellia bacterium]
MHDLPEELLERVRKHSHYREVDYDQLAQRFGFALVAERLALQMDVYDKVAARSRHGVKRWVRPVFRKGILTSLYCSGQLGRARRMARDPLVVQREVYFERLPEAFDGYRILHLSDFHFDYTEELPEIVAEAIRHLDFDVCVLTGDFRGETYGPYEESLRSLERTREALGPEVYAVLGNHDNLEIMLRFPDMGIHGLLNESVWLEKDGARILLAGVDDPHYYKTHDFSSMRADVNAADVAILLAHSPEVYRQAAGEGFDFMLSGHTHGGQICLPGGRPVIAHVKDTPREMVKGPWSYQRMQGYTSTGVGTSTLDCRLNCRSEITLHILRKQT